VVGSVEQVRAADAADANDHCQGERSEDDELATVSRLGEASGSGADGRADVQEPPPWLGRRLRLSLGAFGRAAVSTAVLRHTPRIHLVMSPAKDTQAGVAVPVAIDREAAIMGAGSCLAGGRPLRADAHDLSPGQSATYRIRGAGRARPTRDTASCVCIVRRVYGAA
jgi:hypothetical protein